MKKWWVVGVGLKPTPTHDPSLFMLSIIIPAYNEASRILPTLEDIFLYFKEKKQDYELIVVDDGSADPTAGVVESFCQSQKMPFRILKNSVNSGKGFSVKKGVLAGSGDLILFMDADGSTSISELDRLLPYINTHPIVIGSRYSRGDTRVIMPLIRRWVGRISNCMIRLLLLPGIRDTQCGFKLFQRGAALSLFPQLTIDRWGFDFELLYLAREKGFSICEVPVDWIYKTGGKIRPIRDLWRTLGELVRLK
ncbi:MAG: glycosyl transferase [Parcubacteria group bacterium Gr01-1014_18]|nr:MAG: glycosyl transferase [Parcubacteria group bacterium Greene0416_36]TSC79769.1 MAG: glycosyl transferase [Parcubacteria group bacterium Gr01-1014_18]TSC97971.1 MAG: glycosyl transferase [Parcubacteria group bacterium Greene1014_20]TSD06600.1 MAG: glycosyl transferase [Parcubacteria group bacterium Greene0714_2]